MTHTPDDLDLYVTRDDDEAPLSPAELEQVRRGETFAAAEHSTPDQYPRLTNLSVGFLKRAVLRPVVPSRPEYLTVSMPIRVRSDEETVKKHLAVAEWNMLWEAGRFRRRFFDDEDLTPDLARIADRGDHNVILMPRTRSRYYEYAPLFHLLSRRTLEHFGLPLLRAGQWPYTMDSFDVTDFLPDDFEDRLAPPRPGRCGRT